MSGKLPAAPKAPLFNMPAKSNEQLGFGNNVKKDEANKLGATFGNAAKSPTPFGSSTGGFGGGGGLFGNQNGNTSQPASNFFGK